MKKIILASVVASALLASSSTYEITPMIGYVNTKDHVDIENHAVAGISASRVLSDESVFSALEIGLLQSGNADYDNNNGDTKLTQIFYNAIKDYKLNDSFKVYALAGLGYEHISSEKLGNESDTFFNYGVGAAYTFANNMALKLDVRHQLKFDGDKNIVTLLGLSIPFGTAARKSVELDSDHDGVTDSNDKCPTTKANVKVNSVGCETIHKIDLIVSEVDKTLITQTTQNVVVNVVVDLGIVFKTNSVHIKDSDIVKFERYVDYLTKIPNTQIILEGHII
jgi:OOP family OmpA-OmpF porin